MKNKRPVKRSIISLAVAAIVLLILGIVVVNRAFDYEYNQRNDYQYSFDSFHAEIVEIEIKGNEIELAVPKEKLNTAFIELEINSTISGFMHQPEIKMHADEISTFQNFECRAKGLRYLNVSEFLQQGAEKIELELKGCKLKSKKVRLICYRNETLDSARILILSPHPDDAEIAAYGLYASNPASTFIATITAGDAGSMRYDELYSDSTTHYIKKGKVRVWNSITVPQLGGISPEHAINLGYFDASLKMMHNDTTVHGLSRYLKTDNIKLFRSKNGNHLPDSINPESTWRSLVNDFKYLILKEQPTIIASTYPAIDTHNDHKFTTVALIQAMQELNYDGCELWLYTNHFPLIKMYPDGKIRSVISLPPYFENNPIYFDKLCSFPLSEKLQSDKAMALDAMNDLRPDTQYRNTKASWLQTKQNFFDKLYLKESDYFRRSVRSNELFFVIEGKNALQADIQTKIFGEMASPNPSQGGEQAVQN